MASPFKIFRKRQKVMIATLTLLAMGAFVFLPPLMRILGGRGGRSGQPSNPVVIRWDYGKLRDSDLDRMVLTRRVLNRFVQVAAQLGAQASGTTPQPHPGFGPATQRDVVRTMVFAQAAEDAGFVISDGAINRYIRQVTRNSVSPARLRRILRGTYINGQPAGMEAVFAALRTELLAQQFLGSYLIAADSVTPLERWITWMRINDRVSVELIPVAVQAFIDDVPGPTDDQLQAFYDQYKDVIKRPVIVGGTLMDTPQPGFKEPHRATFESVRADYDAVVEAIKPTITDAEIEKYYHENQRNFVQPKLLEDESGPEKPATQQQPPATREGPATTPDARKSDQPTTGVRTRPTETGKVHPEGQPAGTTVPGEKPTGQKGTTEPPAKKGPGKQAPAKEAPAKEAPAKQAPAKQGAAETGGSEGRSSLRSVLSPRRVVIRQGRLRPFRFAVFQKEPAAQGADSIQSPPSANPPVTEPTPPHTGPTETGGSGGTAAPADKRAGKSAVPTPSTSEPTAKPAAVPPAAVGTKPDGLPGVNAPAAATGGGAPARAATHPKDAEPTYAPLDQVRDQIRSELARRRAPDKMAEALKPLETLIKRYHDDFTVWQVEEEDRPKGTPPAPRPTPPDVKKWATEHAMTYEATAPVSFFQLRQMDLGRSVVRADGQPFASMAFTVLDEYRPVETEDFQGNRYLAWKIADTQERVPTLDEVRDQVVKAWKMKRARSLARKAAAALAEKAKTAAGTLSEVFEKDPAHKVIHSDPFSWYTVGAVPGGRNVRLRISQVFGVDGAGPEFMQKVFAMDVGDVAVAMNHAQSTAYVIRLASKEESKQDLHARFLKEANLLEQIVRRQNQIAVVSSLLRDLRETTHLEGWESLDTEKN